LGNKAVVETQWRFFFSPAMTSVGHLTAQGVQPIQLSNRMCSMNAPLGTKKKARQFRPDYLIKRPMKIKGSFLFEELYCGFNIP
jgi:hypothetical protein